MTYLNRLDPILLGGNKSLIRVEVVVYINLLPLMYQIIAKMDVLWVSKNLGDILIKR